jgi:hypothetical protein
MIISFAAAFPYIGYLHLYPEGDFYIIGNFILGIKIVSDGINCAKEFPSFILTSSKFFDTCTAFAYWSC